MLHITSSGISRQLLFKHVAYHNFNMDLQLNASWCDFWGDTSATNSNILLNRVRLQPLSVAVYESRIAFNWTKETWLILFQ